MSLITEGKKGYKIQECSDLHS